MPRLEPSSAPRGAFVRRAPTAALAVALLAFVFACTAGPGSRGEPGRAAPPTSEHTFASATAPADDGLGDRLTRGLELYDRHCAICHGDRGRGDGPVAAMLDPRPRDFARGQFRIVSTSNLVPTDDDLWRTIRDGMLGSSMPPFGHLREDELAALVEAVQFLALEGETERQLAAAPGSSRAEAVARARELWTPGRIVPDTPRPRMSWASLQRGEELYARDCVQCHAADGRGVTRVDMIDDAGHPIMARDFTRGIFKGGADAAQLVRRILLGVPGTPMPAYDYSDEDAWAVVDFLHTMIDPEAQDRAARRHRAIAARRVDFALDTDPYHPAWPSVTPNFVRLMPMRWRFDRAEGVHVQAMHDGRRLALRLSWRDDVADDGLRGHPIEADGVAVELAGSSDVPFFGMGDALTPVDLHLWRADRQRLSEADVETLLAHGNAVLQAIEDPAAPLAASGSHDGDRWHVVFLFELDTDDARAGDGGASRASGGSRNTLLQPGAEIEVALAVWDAALGDRGPLKSVSVWQTLQLEP